MQPHDHSFYLYTMRCMKKLILLTLLLMAGDSYSQALKKYPIAKTGCAVYMYCNPGEFVLSFSEDSSKVYTATCNKDGFTYGVICVQLADSLTNMNEAEDLLESYLDFLKGQFHIRESAGYGKGSRLNNNENTRGIIDYWEAEDKTQWSVQGWINPHFLCILYLNGKTRHDYNQQKVFFNSLQLPAS